MPRLAYDVSGGRQIRATAVGRGTHGVPDVGRMVASQFHIAFPHRVWVAGVVGAPHVETDGTLSFVLDPSTGDDVFTLPCVVPADGLQAVRELLHRSHDADLEDVVRERRLARVGGLLRVDLARGSVVLFVSELDPTPTALALANAREQAMRAVVAARLADRQRSRTPATAPLEVTVIGGAGDAMPSRVAEQLACSGFDVATRVVPVALAGDHGPRLLASAVRSAGERSDVVLLVRGEGRPLGLVPYDAVEVARAVADVPVPVLTGLGGGGIRTSCDEVAYASLPTAEATVHWVVDRLSEAEHSLDSLAGDVHAEVTRAGERCRRSLEQVGEEIDRVVEDAAARSVQVRRRRRVQLFGACALLAVLVVVAAAVTGAPLLLAGLVVPVVVLGGVLLCWRRAGTRGSRRMGQRDEDFNEVLRRLHAVRDELTRTASPERVGVLRERAQELVSQGRQLLGRHLEPHPATTAHPMTTALTLPGDAFDERTADGAAGDSTEPATDQPAGGAAGGRPGDSAGPAPDGTGGAPDAEAESASRT